MHRPCLRRPRAPPTPRPATAPRVRPTRWMTRRPVDNAPSTRAATATQRSSPSRAEAGHMHTPPSPTPSGATHPAPSSRQPKPTAPAATLWPKQTTETRLVPAALRAAATIRLLPECSTNRAVTQRASTCPSRRARRGPSGTCPRRNDEHPATRERVRDYSSRRGKARETAALGCRQRFSRCAWRAHARQDA